MLVTTHTLATISLGKAMGLKTTQDWFLAFLFGVLIDLDHLKIFQKKYRQNGNWRKFFLRELPIRTFIQEPVSILWVVPLSFYLHTPIPMIFWSFHVFLDYLVDGVRKPFWPFSSFTLRHGLLPANTFFEFLFSSFPFLLFLFGFVKF